MNFWVNRRPTRLVAQPLTSHTARTKSWVKEIKNLGHPRHRIKSVGEQECLPYTCLALRSNALFPRQLGVQRGIGADFVILLLGPSMHGVVARVG